VDPVSRREFWKLLGEFVDQGLTIVMATPYLDEAERCHRIVMLHEGRRLALDAPARLQAAMSGAMLEVVVESPRRALDLLARRIGLARLQLFGDRLHVRVGDPAQEAEVRRLLDEAGLEHASVRRIVPGLEDVFIEYVTGGPAAAAGARPASDA
jgi:ABC-2 type transport system ATP-binding protein